MNISKFFIVLVVLICVVISACKKDEPEQVIDDTNTIITKNHLCGYVQKGPFTIGTTVTVYELNNDYTPTGKSFSTIISDNSGLFELANVSFVSSKVKILANGYYYNENLGRLSSSPLTLTALADLNIDSMININLLTYLEMQRVEYLIGQGSSYNHAKVQAQAEVLDIFNINVNSLPFSEQLNIAQNDTGNAILLAVSCIIQGFRTEAELTELIAGIANDIKTDGVLTNTDLGSALMNHVTYLDSTAIRSYLTDRYTVLGVSYDIPYFEPYIRSFSNDSLYPVTDALISYPTVGYYGQNLLNKYKTNYYHDVEYSLAVNMKSYGRVKIEIKRLSGTIIWGNALGTGMNWTISNFNSSDCSQIYTSNIPGVNTDLLISFPIGTLSTFLISYYEMSSSVPVFTKVITVN